MLEWYPPGRRKMGKPRNSWMQEVTTGMREKRVSNMGRIQKKNKLIKLQAQKDVKRGQGEKFLAHPTTEV